MKGRNCAWTEQFQNSKRAVWTRGGVFAVHCPKSVITANSLHYLEQFRYWKEAGGGALWSIDAKSADAILTIERAWRAEMGKANVEE